MEDHERFDTDSADEQDVRELLAALGRTTAHPDTARTDTDALPEDVARRLDDLLGELTTERARTAAAPVVPLRRTSRRQGWLAAAGIAAAVVLTTVVLPAVLSDDPTPTADTVATADRSPRGEESASTGPVELSGPLVEESPGAYTSSNGARGGHPVPGTPTLRSDTLADDVTDLLTVLPSRPTVAPSGAEALTSGPQNGAPSDDQADSSHFAARSAATCTWDGPGRAYDVTLDDQRALAVVTGRPDTERVVRLLLCVPGEDPVTVATAHVPAS